MPVGVVVRVTNGVTVLVIACVPVVVTVPVGVTVLVLVTVDVALGVTVLVTVAVAVFVTVAVVVCVTVGVVVTVAGVPVGVKTAHETPCCPSTAQYPFWTVAHAPHPPTGWFMQKVPQSQQRLGGVGPGVLVAVGNGGSYR